MSELCRFTTMGPQALKDSTLNTQHCRCCYGLTPWPQWTWNSSQVGYKDRHFFFFGLSPIVSPCVPRGSKQLSCGRCIDPVQGGNIPSGKNTSEISPQVKILWRFSISCQDPELPSPSACNPGVPSSWFCIRPQQSFQVHMASLQSK